ncbi:dephospho-CoA kinase [Sporosalibacterium faouarense]|uniref:dephospho-CoA kinase n=1 Tax=Sporosalibacterium faouarense TaxID=516123 RepID=UPI00192C1D06|nr:dephospho-CoA kinase [Sporosalibacterium faouarense]
MIQSKNQGKVIGLTGGIATGKSTASKYLVEKGYSVIDADVLAREVVDVGRPAYEDILKEFGDKILNEDLTINRTKLGGIIFNSEELRKKLNSIVHPRVTDEMKMQKIKELKDNKLVFLDIPLLIEVRTHLKKEGLDFDEIWLVYIDEETQLQRLMKRDGIDRLQAFKKIKAQMSINEKKKYADVIIDNSGSISDLEKKLDSLLEKYK